MSLVEIAPVLCPKEYQDDQRLRETNESQTQEQKPVRWAVSRMARRLIRIPWRAAGSRAADLLRS